MVLNLNQQQFCVEVLKSSHQNPELKRFSRIFFHWSKESFFPVFFFRKEEMLEMVHAGSWVLGSLSW
jgi:hypothetical protein